ncbi:MAG: divalent-cation tolerance protein CutA [Magnetococcales bacterium]|nr:divalent-cation tolerance protein CutA [Magnetococcales bacterium]
MEENGTIIVWSNAPDRATAERIARGLVERRLAACVHVLPAGVSIYRWEGEIQQGEEWTLMIKTAGDRAGEVMTAIGDMHPYDIPEILVTPVIAGLETYLSWIGNETH